MAPLKDGERRDFLEICDDRYQRRSFILTSQMPIAHWHEQIGDPTLPTASSTAWFITPIASNSAANPCAKSVAGNRTKELPEWASTLLMWGKGTQTPFPCPTPPSRLKTIKLLTHVNNLRHHCKCQRRFAPTYSHRIGTVHSHRRNPHPVTYANRRATWVFFIETHHHTFFVFSTFEFFDQTRSKDTVVGN